MFPLHRRRVTAGVTLSRLLPIKTHLLLTLSLFLGAFLILGCDKKQNESPQAEAKSKTITLAAYSVPREALGQAILPAFKKSYQGKAGSSIELAESYMASGAQSRAIAAGFEADLATLSLEPDIQRLVDAKLVSSDWRDKSGGIVTRSVAVLAVREGNPKKIRDWADLLKPGVEVLTANPRTSGGAMWNVLAAIGAVERGHVPGYEPTREGAEKFLAGLLANVRIMDRSGRESMLTFERGVGDVIITYENEVLVARKQGKKYDYVVPSSTIIIENPVAIVDANADKHGVRKEAESLLKHLFEEQAQSTFASYGFRPVHEAVLSATKKNFADVKDTFSITDLGGWPEVQKSIFAPNALFERSLAASRDVE